MSLPPIALNEAVFQQLIDKRYVRQTEILQATFGEWPLKELDIISAPDNILALIDTDVNALAHAMDIEDGIEPEIDPTKETQGFVLRSQPYTIYLDSELAPPQDVIPHEQMHTLQFQVKSLPEEQSLWQEKIYKMCRRTKTERNSRIKYLGNDEELQAYIYESVIRIRLILGRMPLSKSEFCAAMFAIGVDYPDDCSGFLDISYVAWDKLKQRYLHKQSEFPEWVNAIPSRIVSPLNEIISSVRNDCDRNKFLFDIMPFYYGVILDHFGDKYGSGRIGFSGNQFRRLIFTQKLLENASLTLNDLAPDILPDIGINMLRVLDYREKDQDIKSRAISLLSCPYNERLLRHTCKSALPEYYCRLAGSDPFLSEIIEHLLRLGYASPESPKMHLMQAPKRQNYSHTSRQKRVL